MKNFVLNKKIVNGFIVLTMFAVLVFCVGCNGDAVEKDRLVTVGFGAVSGSGESRALNIVQKGKYAVDTLYWSYTAVKQDGVYKTGEKTTETPVNPSGARLSGNMLEFSAGKWKFTLVAYASADDRTAKTASKVIYTGSTVVVLSGECSTVCVDVSNGSGYTVSAGTLEFEASPTIKVPVGMTFANSSKIVVTVKKGSLAVTSSTTTISGAKAAGTAVTLTNFSTPTNISDGVNNLTVTITYTPSGGTATNLAMTGTAAGVIVPVLVTAGCTTVIGKDWNGCVTYRP